MKLAGTAHASAVRLGEVGLLVCGPSGSGKSALCFALVSKAGARWVGDDQLCLEMTANGLTARPHPALAGKAERRGDGVVNVSNVSEARITHQIVFENDAEAGAIEAAVLHETWQPNLKNRAFLSKMTLPTLILPRMATFETAKAVLTWLNHAVWGDSDSPSSS
ncbi:MAG: hypothetical protein AAF903_07475 [Pseudomonadota bacterium]